MIRLAHNRKKLLSQMKTIYLFQVTNEKGLEASWWVDMKVRFSRLHEILRDSSNVGKKTDELW